MRDFFGILGGGAPRVVVIRVFTVVLLLALLSTAVPGFSYADDTVPPMLPESDSSDDLTDNTAAPMLPESDISDDLTDAVVVISPKSDAEYGLSVKGASRGNGVAVVVKKLKEKDGAEQRFEIAGAGEGVYIIRSVHTGRLIAEKDGAIVQTGMTAASDDSQRWVITKRSGGYVFTNAATANRLSVSNDRVKPIGAADTTDAQIFKISKSRLRLDGYYLFLTENDNVVSLRKASLKDGESMILKKDKPSSVGKQFLLVSSSNGYHMVKNSISFKSLGIKDGSKKDGAGFIQSAYKKNKDQRFRLIPARDGWYYLKSASGLYVSASSDTSGAKIVTASDKEDALKLRLEETEYSSGIPKLDKEIEKLHKKIGTSGNMMQKSFRYVVSHYRHREHPNDFSGDWIARYAWYMASNKYGHCKNFAAIVCVLFRSYGYDARVVTGYVPSRSRGWAVHGWVEASVGGRFYIFDADLNVQLGNRGWYKRSYGNAPVSYRIEKRW
jgi:hypothetical protein